MFKANWTRIGDLKYPQSVCIKTKKAYDLAPQWSNEKNIINTKCLI